jgi:23S rRNA (pseudouridine1915-N3)-methyltransferase
MKIEIIAMGKMRDRALRDLTDDYLGRLEHYLTVDEIELKASRRTDRDEARGLREEAEAMRDASTDGGVTVALDERGKEMTSVEFARQMAEWMRRSVRSVSFFVGSAHGLDPEFRGECNRRLALSKMTLPHEMARMVLAEQLYRAMTIVRREPYHK